MEGILKSLNSIEQFDLGGIQFSPKWGPPEAREVAGQYGIFALDDGPAIGISAAEYGLQSPPASLEFPFEDLVE